MSFFKHEVPKNHACVVTHNDRFNRVLGPGKHKKERLDKLCPPIPMTPQTISNIDSAETKDGKMVFFQYSFEYIITDVYAFLSSPEADAHDSMLYDYPRDVDFQIRMLYSNRVNRLNYQTLVDNFTQWNSLDDREAQMIFEGVERFGVTILSTKMQLCEDPGSEDNYQHSYVVNFKCEF